jgi:hypothetical protein
VKHLELGLAGSIPTEHRDDCAGQTDDRSDCDTLLRIGPHGKE